MRIISTELHVRARAYVPPYLDKANRNALLISLQVCLARSCCPFIRGRTDLFLTVQPRTSRCRVVSRRVVRCRAAPRRAAQRSAAQRCAAPRGHATPCRCRADLLSSRVPAHPHGSVRSSGSVLIGGWQSGQADRFSLTASLSVSLSLSRPPARASPPRRLVSHLRSPSTASFPSILSSSLLRSIFFSSETHFPRLRAAACLSVPFSPSPFHPFAMTLPSSPRSRWRRTPPRRDARRRSR